MTGALPLSRNPERPAVLPVKYGDNLWLREMSDGDAGRFSVRKIKLRCRISDPDDPSDPSAPQTAPIYGPIEIPGLEGRMIVGAHAPAFSIDPSGALDPSSPDPSAGDIGVVRVITAVSGPRCIKFGLFSLDDPGNWPGATTGTLVTPKIDAANGKYGLINDWAGNRDGAPAGASYLRETVAHVQQETDPGDVDISDPSSVIEYQLQLTTGSRIRVFVPATLDQPVVGEPWPLDRDDSRVTYQVLDTQQNHEAAFPRRNAFVVPNVTDDPLAGDRANDAINRSYIQSVRTELTQDPVDPSVSSVQVVTLSDGRNINVPVGVLVIPGMEFDPSGNDPSAGDPSGLSPEAIDPEDFWEFEMYLILEEDDRDGDQGSFVADPSARDAYTGTLEALAAGAHVGGGMAADPWDIWPPELGAGGAPGGVLQIIVA